jgi:hypothetical protein
VIDFLEVKINKRNNYLLKRFTDELIWAKDPGDGVAYGNIPDLSVKWSYSPITTSDKFPQLYHGLLARNTLDPDYNEVRSRPNSPYWGMFNEIVETTLNENGIENNGVTRACINMTYHIPGYEFFDPHVDSYFDHYNVILYLNETEGNTVVFDVEGDKENPEQVTVNGKTYDLMGSAIDYNDVDWENDPLPIKHECKPEFGKMFIVNGKYFHSIRNPTPGNLRIISVFNVAV